jgi:hypothetical protein
MECDQNRISTRLLKNGVSLAASTLLFRLYIFVFFLDSCLSILFSHLSALDLYIARFSLYATSFLLPTSANWFLFLPHRISGPPCSDLTLHCSSHPSTATLTILALVTWPSCFFLLPGPFRLLQHWPSCLLQLYPLVFPITYYNLDFLVSRSYAL